MMRHMIGPITFASIVMTIVVGGIYLGVSDTNTRTQERKDCYQSSHFTNGDFVESVLSGQRGQVTRVRCYKSTPRYRVRFEIISAKTNVSLFGSDGPITSNPFSTVWMELYELREATQ